MTRLVVNHLRLAKPLPAPVINAAEEACAEILAAGAQSAGVVQIDETHAILVLAFPDLETEERISSEIGGPWMREHVVPLLASPPERSSGVVVAGLRTSR
jgi:hypothetical protein